MDFGKIAGELFDSVHDNRRPLPVDGAKKLLKIADDYEGSVEDITQLALREDKVGGLAQSLLYYLDPASLTEQDEEGREVIQFTNPFAGAYIVVTNPNHLFMNSGIYAKMASINAGDFTGQEAVHSGQRSNAFTINYGRESGAKQLNLGRESSLGQKNFGSGAAREQVNAGPYSALAEYNMGPESGIDSIEEQPLTNQVRFHAKTPYTEDTLHRIYLGARREGLLRKHLKIREIKSLVKYATRISAQQIEL